MPELSAIKSIRLTSINSITPENAIGVDIGNRENNKRIGLNQERVT